MLSRVIAKNIGDVFLRHSVVLTCRSAVLLSADETVSAFLFIRLAGQAVRYHIL